MNRDPPKRSLLTHYLRNPMALAKDSVVWHISSWVTIGQLAFLEKFSSVTPLMVLNGGWAWIKSTALPWIWALILVVAGALSPS